MERKVSQQALAEVEQVLPIYEQAMKDSNYSPNTQHVHRGYVRQFVRWLAGDFSPLDYDGTYLAGR